jgi:hypothetical protein
MAIKTPIHLAGFDFADYSFIHAYAPGKFILRHMPP